jgi:hypothetical protein
MDYAKIPDYLWDYIGVLRGYVAANERDIVLLLCGAIFFVFLVAWRALRRSRRLSNELEELRQSTERLFANEEARLLRELRNRPKLDMHDRPARRLVEPSIRQHTS